jgi:16S rRNA (cytosine1402-N4)-methyltransferase
VRPGERWVDCTLGFGGHTSSLLEAGARVTGLDQDPAALAAASHRLVGAGDRFTGVRANFRDLGRVVEGPVDGVLADIGVSSWQLDQARARLRVLRTWTRGHAHGPRCRGHGARAAQSGGRGGAGPRAASFGEEPFAGRIARDD